ncbi:zf-TFIIB domain-containing protein [Polyangium aurulentum]|uniref:zf-TFIIB domain-containing protein n=1 Tax=Polyangium aurulentum TaxID=2567896 RepID=UPI0010AE5C17|nr:zf-TFIIB domain-containing protein [Polyangium aurulentum]UQA56672.1 zf-TFIIB domain-containing protein [Polyangium aurulentum]
MTEHYRAAALPCPLCAGMLEERATQASAVDVCTDCAGVWIDWFDGEISAVARNVTPERTRTPPAPAPSARARSCPRCNRGLDAEPFRDQGPQILRCPDCAGVFIPPGALAEVVAMGPPEDRPSAEPSVLSRLVEALRRLLAERRA